MHYTLPYIRQLLVDASASMDLQQELMPDIVEEHLAEFRRFVDRHPEGDHRFGISVFSTELKPVFGPCPVDALPELSGEDLRTDGDTALFDACWRQLDLLEEFLVAEGIAERAQVDFHLITDGVDTASTTVRFADLRQRIEALRATGRWTFHFHEADLDTIELNALLGLRRQLAETVDPRQLREALVEFLTPGTPDEGQDQAGNL